MQRDVGVESEVATQSVPTWARFDGAERGSAMRRESLEWQSVDNALRALHARRCGIDAEEARWLRAAEALQIWRPLGMVSALDYMERVLGYAPRTAKERLRVARALAALPLLDGALARGELPYSAARELIRVATPDSEAAWVDAARDRNLREIEQLVADRKPGDRPTDPKDPAARTHVVRLELSAETFALLRQTRQVLDDEHGTSLTEDQLIAAMCQAVLDGEAPGDATGRAKFQVAVTVCERCQQGWQHGAGAEVPISAAAVERALCDAQHIGSVDDDRPARAYQDVSPSVARLVWHRDAGRCRVPGCRSARGLETHHIVHRADNGSHEPRNIVLLCSSCHQGHHAGTLSISGTADKLDVRRPDRSMVSRAMETNDHASTIELASGGTHVGTDAASVDPRASESGPPAATAWEQARLRQDATQALTQLGWRPAVARAAVEDACRAGGATTLERLVFEACRRCARLPS